MDEPRARIVLHGRLRKRFGPEFRMSASTPARAVQMLCIMVPGFRNEISKGAYRVIRGSVRKGVAIDERALMMRLGPSGEMHLFPAAVGAKGSTGAAKIVIGVALIVASIALPELFPATFALYTTTIGSFGILTSVALFGGSLILGGLAQLLSPQPKTPTATNKDSSNANSFLLGGQLNVTSQGGPVPVVYGRILVGSVVISLGYESAAYVTEDAIDGYIDGDGSSGFSGQPAADTASGGGREEPNTLRSVATVRLIDLLSEGEIGGLVDGPKSIYFNNTPLMAADGSWNFKGVHWNLRKGTADQDPLSGFPSSEEVISVGTPVLHSSPVTKTVNSTTADAMRITIQISALYETDTTTGEMHGTNLDFFIEVRPSRAGTGGFIGGYDTAVSENIVGGKCTSPYERSYRIDLPRLSEGANTWDVRITRTTVDSTSVSLANGLTFAVITMITDHKLAYPDSAYIGITLDSQAFGGNVPTRTYLIDGRKVQVPANYDPVARTYASSGPGTTGGTWDATTFKAAVTSNPTWIFYDMLTAARFGCGLSGTSLETTRASLYVISQYADGSVPDGFGGNEPRYHVNVAINTQVEAYTMLQTMVSAFRGMTYWGAGQVMVTADMPKDAVKVVNQASVVGGMFDYQSTSLKTRHNLARVTWVDPSAQYQAVPEAVEMTADIARRGVVATDVVAWGCVSRGLAHRLGKWLLYTEQYQTETLEYAAGLEQLDLRPGEVFQQHDPAYFGLRWGGRLRSGSTTSLLHLDAILNPDVGTAFTVSVTMPDNTLETQNFPLSSLVESDDGVGTDIQLPFPFSMTPTANAEWIVIDNVEQARWFSAISIGATQPGRFQVSAVSYDPNKFDYVERDIALKPHQWSLLPALITAALAPPSNVAAVDYLAGIGTTTILRVTVSWTPASDNRIEGYEVRVTGVSVNQIYAADGASKDIDNLVPDTYDFAVRSVGHGQTSVWVTASAVVVDGRPDPPLAPLGLTAIGGTRRVQLTWSAVVRRDLKFYEVQRASNSSGSPGSFSTLNFVAATAMVDGQSDLLIPLSRWWYRVRAITTLDIQGEWSNTVSATTTQLIVDDLTDGIINTAKFARSLKPVGLVQDITGTVGLPGDITFDEKTGRLYKWVDGRWVGVIDYDEITGELNQSHLKALDASKITGDFTDKQLARLDIAKMSGTLTTDQMGKIDAAKLIGQVPDGSIGDVAAWKLTGDVAAERMTAIKITAAQIRAGAIAAGEVVAGSVTAEGVKAMVIEGGQVKAGGLDVGAVLAGNIDALTIKTMRFEAGQVKAGGIDVGAVNALSINVDAITAANTRSLIIQAGHLDADSVTFGTIAGGAVRSEEIYAGSIGAAHLAADFALISSAQIGRATIQTGNISDLQVTSAKIGNLEVNTSNIQNNAVSNFGFGTGDARIGVYVQVMADGLSPVMLWAMLGYWHVSWFRIVTDFLPTEEFITNPERPSYMRIYTPPAGLRAFFLQVSTSDDDGGGQHINVDALAIGLKK